MKPVITKLGVRRFCSKPPSVGVAPVCVFLTATIAPPQDAVARYDPNVRLRDYLDALQFYLSLPTNVIDRIVFVDNSGSDITPVEEFVRSRIADKSIELMSFDGNNHPVNYGKAYGEFKLLDFGINHTSLLNENDNFWKVTGRLKVLNLDAMIVAVRTQYDLLCDLHNFPFVGTGKAFGNHWMELRVFSCTKLGYQKLFAGKYREFGPRINQDVLYDVVMRARNEMRVQPRFPEQPIIAGISGRHDRDYYSGMQKIKTAIRAHGRKYVPFIWM